VTPSPRTEVTRQWDNSIRRVQLGNSCVPRTPPSAVRKNHKTSVNVGEVSAHRYLPPYYNGSAVFGTIMCASCRQLISVVSLYRILNILLKYLNAKMVVEVIKIQIISMSYGAKLQLCFSSNNSFGVRPAFPLFV
jgi:hypothetical protein